MRGLPGSKPSPPPSPPRPRTPAPPAPPGVLCITGGGGWSKSRRSGDMDEQFAVQHAEPAVVRVAPAQPGRRDLLEVGLRCQPVGEGLLGEGGRRRAAGPRVPPPLPLGG